MADHLDQGGDAPCWAHLNDDLGEQRAQLRISASNTILYTDRWPELIAFYRTDLGLRVTTERDWFVEFELYPDAHISVADASRATIERGDGAGLTLSWRVHDAAAWQHQLLTDGMDVSPIEHRWGSPGFFVTDPAGNRIEFWSASR